MRVFSIRSHCVRGGRTMSEGFSLNPYLAGGNRRLLTVSRYTSFSNGWCNRSLITPCSLARRLNVVSLLVQDEPDILLKCLHELEAKPMSLEVLEVSKIGVCIRRLRKHSNPDVAALAGRLYDNWVESALRGRERRKARDRVNAMSRTATENREGLGRFGVQVDKPRPARRGTGFDADVYGDGHPLLRTAHERPPPEAPVAHRPEGSRPSSPSPPLSAATTPTVGEVRGDRVMGARREEDEDGEEGPPAWWEHEKRRRWELRKRRREMGTGSVKRSGPPPPPPEDIWGAGEPARKRPSPSD